MTCKEMLRIEHPSFVGDEFTGGCGGCPDTYGYLDILGYDLAVEEACKWCY